LTVIFNLLENGFVHPQTRQAYEAVAQMRATFVKYWKKKKKNEKRAQITLQKTRRVL
jgi:hypothetical protein